MSTRYTLLVLLLFSMATSSSAKSQFIRHLVKCVHGAKMGLYEGGTVGSVGGVVAFTYSLIEIPLDQNGNPTGKPTYVEKKSTEELPLDYFGKLTSVQEVNVASLNLSPAQLSISNPTFKKEIVKSAQIHIDNQVPSLKLDYNQLVNISPASKYGKEIISRQVQVVARPGDLIMQEQSIWEQTVQIVKLHWWRILIVLFLVGGWFSR